MTGVRARGEKIRSFILKEVAKSPDNIAARTAARFDITRQAVNKHLHRLVAEGALLSSGATRRKVYALAPLAEWHKAYPIESGLAEDVVWARDISGVLGSMPDNVLAIWQYGFTEMFNNAIDHSSGSRILVRVQKTAMNAQMLISDDGVGIFRKIQSAIGLLDERHAVLELSKGKLTTDPKRHTGEGIFFTTRMFDSFGILSGNVFFSHHLDSPEDWILETTTSRGTHVWMKLNNHTSRTTTRVFDRFSTGEDYGFNKTVVPVRLAQYGDDLLVSRSQAKRLLARVELFKVIVLDFEGVASIGQAFADEIFRVFACSHPAIELIPVKTNSAVRRMIARASPKPS